MMATPVSSVLERQRIHNRNDQRSAELLAAHPIQKALVEVGMVHEQYPARQDLHDSVDNR